MTIRRFKIHNSYSNSSMDGGSISPPPMGPPMDPMMGPPMDPMMGQPSTNGSSYGSNMMGPPPPPMGPPMDPMMGPQSMGPHGTSYGS